MILVKLRKTFFLLLPLLVFFFFLNLFLTNLNTIVFSSDLQKKETELGKKEQEQKRDLSQLEQVKQEIARVQSSGYSVDQQIRLIDAELKRVEDEMFKVQEEIVKKEESISLKELDLAEKQKKIEGISEKLYKNSRYSFLEILFQQGSQDSIIQTLIFNRFAIASQVLYMRKVSEEMKELEIQKNGLEAQKEIFEKDKAEFDESKNLLAQEKAKLQRELNTQIRTRGALTNRLGVLEQEISDLQKAILAAKSGNAVVSVGDVPRTGDFNATYEGFINLAPAGSFAVFSLGAYSHRNGMSQYGALARANSGQTYVDILSSYYGKAPDLRNTSGTINVEGFGNLDFETTYLYGIAEMPSSWPLEALKAQAIAARSYALRHKNEGRTICITERCQVFSKSKSDNPPLRWKEAVDSTRGLVLEGVLTQYSSTSGGFLNTSGWDTTDKTDLGNWTSRAWESIAGSPWFYRAWYRLGYSDSAPSCNRNPWMTNEEMSDILNAWLIVYKGEGINVDSRRIVSVTINSCPVPNFNFGNPYSMSELRSLLNNPVTSITGKPTMVRNSSLGITTTVSFQTNRGRLSIPAGEFKAIFNMRAPGYIHIPQSGFTHIEIQSK